MNTDTSFNEVIARCSPLAKDYVTLALRNKAMQKEAVQRLAKIPGEIHAYDVEETLAKILEQGKRTTPHYL